MAVLFPLDDDGHPIPVLGFDYRGTLKLAVGPISVRNAAPIPADVQIVSLIATGLCRFEVGDQSVTADSARARSCSRASISTCRCAAASATWRSSPTASHCDAYIIGRV